MGVHTLHQPWQARYWCVGVVNDIVWSHKGSHVASTLIVLWCAAAWKFILLWVPTYDSSQNKYPAHDSVGCIGPPHFNEQEQCSSKIWYFEESMISVWASEFKTWELDSALPPWTFIMDFQINKWANECSNDIRQWNCRPPCQCRCFIARMAFLVQQIWLVTSKVNVSIPAEISVSE
jgi:hypothetical protein